MTARTLDASTTEGYAAALLLLAERVTRFGLQPPLDTRRVSGDVLSMELGIGQMAAVDNWVSALGLPEAELAGKTYKPWRAYRSAGIAEGIGFEVWCWSDVNLGEATS